MPSAFFHQGDLNSGISRAIQEQKLVACFVHGDDEESAKWENEWLENTTFDEDERSLGDAISDKAILLRIQFGSKEASFLDVFCPIKAAPTLAIIHNGTVLDRIESGIEQDEFLAVISRVLGQAPGGQDLQEADTADGETTATGGDESTSHTDPAIATAAQDTTQPTPLEPTASNPQLQQILSERGARLEVERKKREAVEKERIKEANARRKAAEQAAEASSAAKPDKGKQRATSEQSEQQKAREAWIYQQKKRKEEAKQERERILAQIEADKRDRKIRAEQAREAQAASGEGAFSELPSSHSTLLPPSKAGNSCSLQVRLFDGSSIRAKFSPDEADIATAVRTWVKETSPDGGADQPFTFRQILAPQPSRSIEVSEEHQTLRELGLVPNATLVLVPVAQFTTAYSNAGGGYVGSALNGAYHVANTGYNLLGSILSYVPGFAAQGEGAPQGRPSQSGGLYMGGTGDEQERSNVEGARMANSDSASAGSAQIRVKTLADQRAEAAKKQGAEFYNGNSLRFEGEDEGGANKK